MKLKAYMNRTTLDASKDMISAIDYSDFSIEHIVVVPDRFSLLMEKMLLQNLKNSALFNVKVMGLTSLATEIFKRLNKKVEVLSSAECLLLTQKAIENVKDKFKTFRKSSINFCYEINKVLSQLKSCKIGPEQLNENAPGLSGGKYHDLKLVYSEYQNLLQGKFDANERLALLNDVIRENNILNNTCFYFAQFDSFTSEGYGLIKTLVECSKQVCVSVASSLSIGNDYIYEKDIIEKLIAISKECGIEIEVIDQKTKFSPQKQAIISGVYSYNSKKTKNNGFYSVYSSQNIHDEVKSCAKLIYYFTTQGYSYKDITVAVSDINRYELQLEQTFSKFDIPLFIDSSVTADNTMLVGLIFNFFETITLGYPNDKLQGLFSNILLGENQELIENAQKYIVNNRWKYKKYLAGSFKYDYILDKLSSCLTAKDFSVVIQEICDIARENIEQIGVKLENIGLIKERDINRQIEEIVSATTELITKYNDKISINEYLKTLKLLLSFKEVSTVPSFIDGVMVGDATASYFGESRILIILGCQDLPVVSNDNGLLNDKDISLNYLDKKIEPSIRMLNRRNRFRLFQLLTTASERLILFSQAVSDEGKKNEMPAFIDSLNQIFSQKTLKTQVVFYENSSVDTNLLVKLGNYKNFVEENLNKLSKQNINQLDIIKDIPFKDFVINKQNILNGEKLFIDNRRVSVTELEKYFSCPFKHFLTYGLNLKEKEIYAFDARDTGNISHKGAELFVIELIKGNKIDIREFIDLNFNTIIESAGAKEKLENASEKESLINFFKHQLYVMLNDILNEYNHSGFKPKYVEYKLANITLGLSHKVNISGKVDRIDECGEYFRIVDYKTGRTGNILKELYYGEKLQLFLYQKIVMKMLNKKPSGVFYFNAKYDYESNDEEKTLMRGIAQNEEEVLKNLDLQLNDENKSTILGLYIDKYGVLKGSVVAKEDLQDYQDYAEKVSGQAIEELADGYIEPKPNEASCDFCQYRSICIYEKLQGKRKAQKVGNFKDILKNE